MGRDGDGPASCVGLGWSEDEGAVGELVHAALDAYSARREIEIAALEAEQLTSPEPAPGGEEDEGPEAGNDGVGEGLDVGDRAFGCR